MRRSGLKTRRVVAATAKKTAACGCEGGSARRAVGVDPALKAANLAHLRRIEGQVRGVIGMIESDRYCADVITQVSAVRESLSAVARNLMKNHLQHCAKAAISSGEAGAQAMYDELMDLVGKLAK